jgi:hypothetical protein
MNCRTVCLSDSVYLPRDSNGIDYKHSCWGGTGLSSFDYPDQTFAHPSTVIGTVQAFTSPLKRAPFVFDPGDPFFDEVACANYMRAVPFPQQFRKG